MTAGHAGGQDPNVQLDKRQPGTEGGAVHVATDRSQRQG